MSLQEPKEVITVDRPTMKALDSSMIQSRFGNAA